MIYDNHIKFDISLHFRRIWPIVCHSTDFIGIPLPSVFFYQKEKLIREVLSEIFYNSNWKKQTAEDKISWKKQDSWIGGSMSQIDYLLVPIGKDPQFVVIPAHFLL